MNSLNILRIIILVFGAICESSQKICNPMDYGAKGDGKTNDTLAIQKAINDCISSAKINPTKNSSIRSSYPNANNAKVYLPSDKKFLSYPITFYKVSNITFEIDSDATLLIGTDISKWPSNTHFFNVIDVTHFTLNGKGTIDGQGINWWSNTNQFRPNTVYTHNVDNLIINSILVQNCPTHCLEIYANNVEISYITILNPPSTNAQLESHNTDGIDVHGSPFWVHDCYISTGDDNVALHANDTLIENNYFGDGHGASIGSLDGGWLKNITVRNIEFNGTTNGLRIKSKPGSSHGKLWDVYYYNINMINVDLSLYITQFYDSNDEKTSYLLFDGIYFENITSIKATNDYAGIFQCQDSTPCKNIQLKNVYITNGDGLKADFEFECLNAYGTADNVSPSSCLKSENV